MILIAITSASLPTKKRILTVCVKLFLEKGYKQTTLAEINEKAGVSFSQFQNIFRAKDGVLTELVEFMFENQFAMARSAAGAKLPPIYVYAVETAIQMTLTELNENLREIYIEAYTQKEASEFIFRETAKELYQIFGPYQPELTARDFYDMEIGSASIMRGYMAHPCDEELTLEKKLRLFLTMSLRAYNVPKEETEQAIRFVEGLDIRTISEQVMQALFRALAMRFELSLAGITLPAQKEKPICIAREYALASGYSPMQSPLAPKRASHGGREVREKKVRNDYEKTTAQHPAHVLYGADTAANNGFCGGKHGNPACLQL